MLGCSVRTLPSFALRDAMLTMLVCATHWLFMHLYTLAYMFMHESCLLVLSMLQHNEVMDIRSKPTFVPGRHLLLCVFLACFPPCLLVSFLAFVTCCACHIYLAYLLCDLVLLSAVFPSIACLLVFLSLPLHVHIWREDAWS